ncbi:MAG: signal recognition particle receptor subunit alpha, partial [Deltaproteobacteria bacterium]|nr:signal recognition particle receptor subunit alpha [Deltaproteobacteria bacterium]
MNWFKKKKTEKNEQLTAEIEEQTAGPEPQLEEETLEADVLDSEIEEKKIGSPPQDESEAKVPVEAPQKKKGFFKRLKKGLSKTRQILTTDIDDLFNGERKLDDDLLEELEELLITSDIGVATAMDLIETISKRSSSIQDASQLKDFLKKEIL